VADASSQPAILRPPPGAGRFVTFELTGAAPGSLERLERLEADPHAVVGLGTPLIGRALEGLRPFPADLPMFPSTQHALWLFLGHSDRGAAFDAGRAFARALGPGFKVVEEIDAFQYRGGRDLSGFEDGTENPKGAAAEKAALVRGRGKGLDGGSFVAVQRWVHNLTALEAMPTAARDAVVGRNRSTNEELADAPLSAHVKRTAQESFDPEAFVLRRSMPWGGIAEHGLYFVAYGESLDRFERQLRRMAGMDDGVVDALTAFSRAMTGGYYFCPPVHRGRLDLRGIR
jgi:putative iron-dependent peroxidase